MKGFLLAALSVIGFASTFIIGSALTKRCGVSAEVLSFMRFAIAGSVLAAIELGSAHRRAALREVSREDWLKMAWLGPIGTALMAYFVFLGCARVSAANASMADALTPLMIFAVAQLRRFSIDVRGLIGLICGFAGAMFVVQVIGAGGIALEAYSLGDVFILLSAATWGVYTVYGRDTIGRVGSGVFSMVTMVIGAGVIGCLLPFTHCVWPSTLGAWGLVLALGLVSTLLPFWTWNAAQKYLPMSVLGISAYFTPVVAVAMAMLFLGETSTPLQWAGTLLIVCSAIVETHRK